MTRLTAPAAIALAMLVTTLPAQAGDRASGERLFKTQCASCHSTEPGRTKAGPSLFGVFGRKYGTATGFRYPASSRDVDLVWNEETLEKYMVNPKSVLPKTAMPYAGLRNPAYRADIVAYLETLK